MIYKVLVGNEHGGAATSSRAILENFLKYDNFKVVFLCKNRFSNLIKSNNKVDIKSFEPPIIASNNSLAKVYKLMKFLLWSIYTMVLLSSYIKRENVRFIHTTNNNALFICLLCKLVYPYLNIVTHWRCIGLASASRYKFLLKKLNRIICISQAVKDSLPLYLHEKCIVIYDGVNVDGIFRANQRNKNKLRSILHLEESDQLWGTIGSYTPIKCHELIIDTFINNDVKSNVKVVLIGSCPNPKSRKYLDYLQKKVQKNNLQQYIYFLEDHVLFPPNEYISDLDLFIGATWNNGLGEGFGLIYIEAMAARVPVLAINVGAAGEIVRNNINGFLINSNSSKELYNKIQELDFSSINNITDMAFKTVLEKFDLSVTMSKLQEFYEECSTAF